MTLGKRKYGQTMGTLFKNAEAIYPISALAKNPKEVKDAAANGLVRITEQGRGAYIFGTEAEFARAIAEAKEEAVYEERLREAILAGRADKQAGRIHTDHAEFFNEVRSRLQA